MKRARRETAGTWLWMYYVGDCRSYSGNIHLIYDFAGEVLRPILWIVCRPKDENGVWQKFLYCMCCNNAVSVVWHPIIQDNQMWSEEWSFLDSFISWFRKFPLNGFDPRSRWLCLVLVQASLHGHRPTEKSGSQHGIHLLSDWILRIRYARVGKLKHKSRGKSIVHTVVALVGRDWYTTSCKRSC